MMHEEIDEMFRTVHAQLKRVNELEARITTLEDRLSKMAHTANSSCDCAECIAIEAASQQPVCTVCHDPRCWGEYAHNIEPIEMTEDDIDTYEKVMLRYDNCQ